MPTITPNFWFDGQAEEAAAFWTSILPDSRIDRINHATADYPSGHKGDVLTVDFTLLGQRYTGLNGGPEFAFNEAISLLVDCDDQAELDRYWDALIADGGEPGPCGWLKDRFGVSWQIAPRRIHELVYGDDPDGAERAMQAMLKMGKLDLAELEAAYRGTAPATV